MFHKNKIGSIIRSTGTVFYSLVWSNSRQGFNGLKFVYSVISVMDNSLPGNTKKLGIAPFVDGQSAISPFLSGSFLVFVLHLCVLLLSLSLPSPFPLTFLFSRTICARQEGKREGRCVQESEEQREHEGERAPLPLILSLSCSLAHSFSVALLHPPPLAPSLHLSLCFCIPLPLCLSIFVSLAHSRACALQCVCHGICNL